MDELLTPEVRALLSRQVEVGRSRDGSLHALGCGRVAGDAAVTALDLVLAASGMGWCSSGCIVTLSQGHPELFGLARLPIDVSRAAGVNGSQNAQAAKEALEATLAHDEFVSLHGPVKALLASRRKEVQAWLASERAHEALVLLARTVGADEEVAAWLAEAEDDRVSLSRGQWVASWRPEVVLRTGEEARGLPLTLPEARGLVSERVQGLLDVIESSPEPARGGRLLAAANEREWSSLVGHGILLDALPPVVVGPQHARVLPGELSALAPYGAVALEPTESPAVVEVACVLAADGVKPGDALRMARVLEARRDR